MAEDPKNMSLVLLVDFMWGGRLSSPAKVLTLARLDGTPLHLAVCSLAHVLSSLPDWKLHEDRPMSVLLSDAPGIPSMFAERIHSTCAAPSPTLCLCSCRFFP